MALEKAVFHPLKDGLLCNQRRLSAMQEAVFDIITETLQAQRPPQDKNRQPAKKTSCR